MHPTRGKGTQPQLGTKPDGGGQPLGTKLDGRGRRRILEYKAHTFSKKKKRANYIAHLSSCENSCLHQVVLPLHRPSKNGVSGASGEFQRHTNTSIFPSP
jgi:hypothetical protein